MSPAARLAAALTLLLATAPGAGAQAPAYRNPAPPTAERVQDLPARLRVRANFLAAYLDQPEHAADLDAAYRAALVGEVPMQNALEGARETFTQVADLLGVLDRSAARRAVAS